MESPLCPPTEPDFRLIETLGFRPGQGLVRRDLHLARMARSAQAMGIPFERARALDVLETASGTGPLRCRLTLDMSGAFDLTTGPLGANPPLWRIAVASSALASDDPWLRHKTTRRERYDRARAALPQGIDEWLFMNEHGELCEGTITNLFVQTACGTSATPPLTSGLLPGILREDLLEQGAFTEAPLTMADLQGARKFHMGNSLRGLIRAELVTA